MKKILFVCPKFYNYYLDIIDELKVRGFEVEFYSDQIEYSKMGLFLNKIYKKRKSKKMDTYINKLIRLNQNFEYDYFILINGKDISQNNASKLRNMIKAKKYVYYAWDSIINFPNIKGFVQYFDSVLSFDTQNCRDFGFKLLPLFYSNRNENVEKKYDYSIIMNFYPNKIDGYELLMRKIPDGTIGFVHLRLKSRLQFLYFKFKYKSFRNYKMKDFKYKNLNRSDVYDIFSQSKAVFDIPLSKQNGLTMRTFEAISHGCKLITTNPSIKLYDFYNETNTLFVDENVYIEKSFFVNNANYDYNLIDKYSLKVFVSQLLDYETEITYLKGDK